MESARFVTTLPALVLFLAACASSPRPAAAPAPAAAQPEAQPAAPAPAQPAAAQPAAPPSLLGDWELQISTAEGNAYSSMLRIGVRGDTYGGFMNPLLPDEQSYIVRSAAVEGQRVTIVMDTDAGLARITGVMRAGNRIEGSYNSRAVVGRLTAQRR